MKTTTLSVVRKTNIIGNLRSFIVELLKFQLECYRYSKCIAHKKLTQIFHSVQSADREMYNLSNYKSTAIP